MNHGSYIASGRCHNHPLPHLIHNKSYSWSHRKSGQTSVIRTTAATVQGWSFHRRVRLRLLLRNPKQEISHVDAPVAYYGLSIPMVGCADAHFRLVMRTTLQRGFSVSTTSPRYPEAREGGRPSCTQGWARVV